MCVAASDAAQKAEVGQSALETLPRAAHEAKLELAPRDQIRNCGKHRAFVA